MQKTLTNTAVHHRYKLELSPAFFSLPSSRQNSHFLHICTLHTVLSGCVQRYLYTLDRQRGGLACPAGWRGLCRLGSEGSWYISAAVVQTVRASSTEKHDSFPHHRGDSSKLLLPVYIYNVLDCTYVYCIQI